MSVEHMPRFGAHALGGADEPLSSYGVVGDCQTGAMIGQDGSVDFLCGPHFNSPAFLCRLLDKEKGGSFYIGPVEKVTGTLGYVPDTNVLDVEYQTSTGSLGVTSFMPVAMLDYPYQPIEGNTWLDDPTNGSTGPMLIRIVECRAGSVRFRMRLKVTPNFANPKTETKIDLLPEGAVASGGGTHVGLYVQYSSSSLIEQEMKIVAEPVSSPHSIIEATFTISAHQRVVFLLGMGRSKKAAMKLVKEELPSYDTQKFLNHTLQCWTTWVAQCTYKGKEDYKRWVKRSALALKLLQFAPSGAFVAALTTSIPELIGGVRNWDYRFTWLRDTTFMLYALRSVGFLSEVEAFNAEWLPKLKYRNGDRDPHLQIMYSVWREEHIPEKKLSYLSGYYDSKPVRVGNRAAEQRQPDSFASVIDSIHMFRVSGGFEKHPEMLKPLWTMTQNLAEHICRHWQEPDNSMWEIRGRKKRYTSSQVMCWVGVDRAVKLLSALGEKLVIEGVLVDSAEEEILERWRVVRDTIRESVMEFGYNSKVGAFTQSYESKNLDASVLLLPIMGFIDAKHPYMVSTVQKIMRLAAAGGLSTTRGYIYRYVGNDFYSTHESGAEGTFPICLAWLITVLAMQDELKTAEILFQQFVDDAGSELGLFSEEFDEETRTLLGNFPQGFTHFTVIASALAISRAQARLRKNAAASKSEETK